MNDMTTRFAQDLSGHKAKIDLGRCMSMARDASGKSFGAQVWDIYRLGRAAGKLTAQDYYYYRLYDDARFAWNEKVRFLSEGVHQSVIRACCDQHYWAVADDKFIADSFLAANGFPVPQTQAVYDRSGRSFGRTRHLDSEEGLTRFLAAEAAYPLFAKPIGGIGSFGALRIRGFLDGRIVMDGDASMSVADVTAQFGGNGYLFQSLLRPHPALADATEAVSTVRAILIVTGDGPRLLHTIWKIPARGNIADNFWRAGNMLAAVEPDTGIVRRAVRGVGPQQEELTRVPGGDAPLAGRAMPDWPRLIETCMEGARLYHATRYQSWDVALTDRGPVVVEVNTGSAFNLAQLAWGRGFLTDEFAEFLRGCGVKIAL